MFIESAVAAAAAEGVPMADITAGICYAIVKNYMHKVAQQSLIGENIVLQGGVAYNPAIVAAFITYFGKKLTVSPYFAISGAYGAAVLAAENMNGRASRFKGFDIDNNTAVNAESGCISENKEFYDRSLAALTAGYDGKLDPKKKTVGVPLVLVIHKLFPMINAYFKALGLNVLLSSPTNEHTIELAQQYAQAKDVAIRAVWGLVMGTVTASGIPEAIAAAVLVLAIGKVLIQVLKRMNFSFIDAQTAK